jgi:hypothetical protein
MTSSIRSGCILETDSSRETGGGMRSTDALWTITLDGEADDTFERLLGELKGYVVEFHDEGGETLDGIVIDAHLLQPTDEDGNPAGLPRRLEKPPVRVHVY